MRYLLRSACLASLALTACSGNGAPPTPQTPTAFATKPAVHVTRPWRLGELARPATSANMTYHGGTVFIKPTVYLVLWGFTGKTRDPHGEGAYLQKFLSGVGGSPWLGTLTQYYSNPGKQHLTNPSHQLVKTWTDSSNVPLHPTQEQVGAEAARAQQHFGDFGSDVMYFVALPAKHDPSDFLAGNYCANHSWAPSGSGNVVYTLFPYNTDFKKPGFTCGEGFVNGAAGTLDGASIVGGHELAEAETDPRPSFSIAGWYAGSLDGEVADKCSWTGAKNLTFPTGTFPTQPLWSNKVHGCTQG